MDWSRNYPFRYIIDHNNEKVCVPHAHHIYSMENIRGRWRLALRILTLADENCWGEPHEILVICFKNIVYPWFAHRKKRQILNDISKYFIHWSIYELFYSSMRKKQNWNNRHLGQMNSNFFNKEFVIFPSKFKWGSIFCDSWRWTSLKRLWNS